MTKNVANATLIGVCYNMKRRFVKGGGVWQAAIMVSPKNSHRAAPRRAAAPSSAAIQRRTRQQHAQERAEDYVEVIADLIAGSGEARATDLAKSLGVTHVTVIRTVQRLQREGLVTTRPYRSIFLTPAGRKLAAEAKARHQTVVAFLESLGVPAATARADAEGIEHHVSPATISAFRRFLGMAG